MVVRNGVPLTGKAEGENIAFSIWKHIDVFETHTKSCDLCEKNRMITGIIEVTQDPEQAGSTLKILSLRLRGMKGQLEELGEETDENVENISKMQGQILNLTKGKVNIFDGAGEFRSTYEIMQDIANVWDELNSTAQADLLETIAGKHRANSVSALLSNWENVEAAVKSATEAEGSAARENAKYVDSVQGRLDKMTTSWQSFANTFMNSNFLKGGISFITSMIEGVEGLIDTFGTIPTLLSVFTAFESLNGIGLFKTIEDQATLSGKRITNIFSDAARQTARAFQTISLKTNSSFKESIDTDVAALEEYEKVSRELSQFGLKVNKSVFNEIFEEASESAKKFASSGKLAKEGIDAFVDSQKAAQVSTLAQNKSLGNAKAIIKEYYSGCKNVAMETADFAKAVDKTNPQLAKQLNTAKSAKGAFAGYITSLVGAKVASIALEAATMALNTALTMGISALISWGISKLDEWIETADELSERVDEVVSKFNDQQGELVKNKASFKSDAERYSELSKRVNELGENVSLTAEEYSEYQNIVNGIAEQVPSLVSGYDSQGNAILNVKGNVEDLTSAYEKLIHAQNQEILTQSADIEKDFDNTVKDNNSQGFWKQLAINAGFGAFMDYDMTSGGAEILGKLLNAEANGDDVNKIIRQIMTDADLSGEVNTALKNAGIDTGTLGSGLSDALKKTLENEPEKIKGIVDNFYGALDIEQMKSLAQATISEAFDVSSEISGMDYSGISETLQNVARQVVSNLDYDFYEELRNSGESVETWVKNMLDQLNSIDELKGKEIEAAFNLQTQFNGGEISYGEYVNGVKDIEKTIDGLGLDEEVENQLKLSLNTEEVKKEYDALTERLVDISTKDWRNLGHFSGASDAMKMATEDAKKFLDSLTSSEYSVFVDLVASGEVDLSQFDIESFRKYLQDEAKFLEAMNYTIAIDVETESLDALNSALSESVSATGLSSDSITALKGRYAELASQGYDLSKMFEETSNGIHLNKNAVSEFEQALASQKLSEIGDENSGALGVLKKRYDELTDEINNCTDAGERASLYSDQQEVAQKINDLATLASQYKGLTSAYNAWQNAESAGNERDMYENIISGFETIEDEISRGWYDDGTIKFLELMTGQTDLAGKSASELKEIWNSLDDTIKGTSYSVKDFFTTNEDGESTSTGAYNFLRAVEELGKNGGLKALKGKNINELVERNSKGKIVSFDFDVVGGDKAIAEALGVSEEMVQIIQRTLDDAGFVVTLDGKYTLLADLKTSAEEANNSLKKLQSEGLKNLKDLDLNFDFDVNTVEGYQEQLEKALNVLDKFRNKDGTLQTDKNGNLVKGAKEALEVAEYYTAAMDKLTEPKIMQIDTSTVDEELQDPIEKMQTIGDLCKEKHLVSLTGDTEEINKVQGEIDKVAKEIEKLDPEIKAKIGIDEDWDAKTIADKIEKGEIEVPAELKLDVQMSEDLKDMRLLMMRQLGLVSEEEVKLKVGYEIDESTVDDLTPDEQKVVVEFIAENEDWFDKLTDEKKKIVIELIGSGVDLSSLEDEEKKVVIEYVEKDTEWFSKLGDEEKKVVVKYVAEHGEIDSWEPEDKEALVRLIVDKDNVDNWKPEDVDAVVKYYADDEQVKDWTPEEKKAFAKYLVDGGEVDGWSPEAKDAFVKYLVDGGDPDKFDPDDKESWVVYKKDSSIPDGYIPNNPNALVTYNKDSSIPDSYDPNDPDATVNYNKNSLIPDNYIPLDPPATVVFDKDTSAVDSYNPPDIFRTVWYTIKETVQRVASGGKSKAAQRSGADPGGGGVNGTANSSGSSFAYGTIGKAYKQGDWRTKKAQTALTGELGREIVVTPQNQWYTVGDNGAEFVNIPRGSIIFNHRQTEELLKNGKVTSDGGRAKALVNGTAFLQGTAFGKGTGGGEEPIVVGTNKNTGKSYTKSSSPSDSADDFEETFDWIEIAIDRVERAIDQLDTKANSVYRSWSERNSNLTSEISKVSSEIDLQQRAYQEYMNAAAGVGLSSSWAAKVRNGTIDISTVKDEVLAEKIKDYQEWYLIMPIYLAINI